MTCQVSHNPHPPPKCSGGSSRGCFSCWTRHSSQAEIHILQFSLVTGQPRACASRHKSFAPMWFRFACCHSRRRSQSSATAPDVVRQVWPINLLCCCICQLGHPIWWAAIHSTAKPPFLENVKTFCHFSFCQTGIPFTSPHFCFQNGSHLVQPLKTAKDRTGGQRFVFKNPPHSH